MKITKLLALMLFAVFTVMALMACDFLNGLCDHNFNEKGYCDKCGAENPDRKVPCTHEYVDGSCTKCGADDPNHEAPCAHYYSNGVCTFCNQPCTHTTYTNGACADCAKSCEHSYVNGVCNICKLPCNHDFEDGKCNLCDTPCTHNYKEGVCGKCGAKDPGYVPADGGASLYTSIIAKYKYLVEYKKEFEELPPKGSNEPEYVDALYEVVGYYDPSMDMGYALKDIDSNGYKELVLMETASRAHAIFHIVDGEAKVLIVFQNGMGYTAPGGEVFYNKNYSNEDGHRISSKHMMKMKDGKLSGIEYGWIDTDADISTDADTVYYTIGEDGVRVELTHDEYSAFTGRYTYHWEQPSRLTRLTGYIYNPILITAVTSKKEADFSTYDSIIKTFGIMHSEVAAGKFEKTYWSSGRYDSMMLFKTEEDYYVYNKLLAACVLIKTPLESDTFGFAKRDLNGDGKDELILLEGTKFNVLAIFTEKDGKAVLLDTYTDIRQAFIDANGYIHVKQGIIPGYYKEAKKNGVVTVTQDSTYTVYEITDGKLTEILIIGEEYRKVGYTSAEAYKWYKIENGVRTEITKEDFDEVYGANAFAAAQGQYNEYTKDNASLTFTELPKSAEI